jgi:uncharacterized membrane protein YcfT
LKPSLYVIDDLSDCLKWMAISRRHNRQMASEVVWYCKINELKMVYEATLKGILELNAGVIVAGVSTLWIVYRALWSLDRSALFVPAFNLNSAVSQCRDLFVDPHKRLIPIRSPFLGFVNHLSASVLPLFHTTIRRRQNAGRPAENGRWSLE